MIEFILSIMGAAALIVAAIAMAFMINLAMEASRGLHLTWDVVMKDASVTGRDIILSGRTFSDADALLDRMRRQGDRLANIRTISDFYRKDACSKQFARCTSLYMRPRITWGPEPPMESGMF